MRLRLLTVTTVVFLLIACSAPPTAAPTTEPTQPPSATPTLEPTATQSQTAEPSETLQADPTVTELADTPTPDFTDTPIPWQEMPIVPTVSDHAREIYERGVAIGRNPQAFAKVGDCGGTPSWFLGPFDGAPDLYRLGDYGYLQDTIAYFAGSFARESVASRPGFNASSIFSSLWADTEQCKPNEGPLICEIRVTNAAYAFIMLGANDVWHQDEFEPQMRRAIEDLIERGVVPILATKADDIEQGGYINATIVRLAQEYDVPLWNFWAAVQHLPDHGLDSDGVHLTFAGNRFDDPKAMSRGWPIRNLTALQALDAVWHGVTGK